jgi:hypothetical protein
MSIHPVSLPSWINAVSNSIVIGLEIGIVNPVCKIRLGTRSVIEATKSVHLVGVAIGAAMAVAHDGRPFLVGRVGRTGCATGINGRIVTISIMRMGAVEVVSNLEDNRETHHC